MLHHPVHRARARLVLSLRVGGLILLLVGAVMAANRVLFAMLGSGQLDSAWRVWDGIGAWHGVFLGLPLLGVGGG